MIQEIDRQLHELEKQLQGPLPGEDFVPPFEPGPTPSIEIRELPPTWQDWLNSVQEWIDSIKPYLPYIPPPASTPVPVLP